MEAEAQEFSTGDVIYIRTTIEPGSKIVGIRAAYKHEDYGEGSSGHIMFEDGEKVDTTYGSRRSREPIPGPYFEGTVTLDYTVPTEQPEGTYHLYHLQFVNANRELHETSEVPQSAFRIVPQTLGLPSISSWTLSKG